MRFFAKILILLISAGIAWAKLPECPLNVKLNYHDDSSCDDPSGHVRIAVIQIKHFTPTQIYLIKSDGRGGVEELPVNEQNLEIHFTKEGFGSYDVYLRDNLGNECKSRFRVK